MTILGDALAAYRLAVLAAADTITDPVRARLEDDATRPGLQGDAAATVLYVLGCPWCLGIWASLAVGLLHRVAPWLVRTLAVSAITTTLLVGDGSHHGRRPAGE